MNLFPDIHVSLNINCNTCSFGEHITSHHTCKTYDIPISLCYTLSLMLNSKCRMHAYTLNFIYLCHHNYIMVDWDCAYVQETMDTGGNLTTWLWFGKDCC